MTVISLARKFYFYAKKHELLAVHDLEQGFISSKYKASELKISQILVEFN